jgi:GntR family transcriptional regulator
LYHCYEQQLGFWIARVDDQIGLGTVPHWPDAAPHALGLSPGAPAVQVLRRAWSQHGVLEEVSSTWFDSRVARYGARWR